MTDFLFQGGHAGSGDNAVAHVCCEADQELGLNFCFGFFMNMIMIKFAVSVSVSIPFFSS